MRSPQVLFLSVLMAIMIFATNAVVYTVTNTARGTAGGVRFRNEISSNFSLRVSNEATKFIWTTFRETSTRDQKDTKNVSLFIDDMDGVAYTINDQIHFSARYIWGYSGDLRAEFTGVMYHEMTHVWQWNGNGQSPGGLIEGIADYVRLMARYAPSHWLKPGGGDRWDQGYDVTARFLEYCNGLKLGFVADLNKKMRTSYRAEYFVELLGKSADQLWADYRGTYSNSSNNV